MPQFPLCRAPLPFVTCPQHKCFQGRLSPGWKAKYGIKEWRKVQLSLQTTGERHSPCLTLQDLAAVLGLRGRAGARDIPGDGRLRFWGIFGAFPPSKPGTPGQEADLPGGHPIAEMILERAENREKKENLFTWPQVDTAATAFPCRIEGSRLPKFPSSAAPLPRP